jgi:uncharacterized protein YggE
MGSTGSASAAEAVPIQPGKAPVSVAVTVTWALT